MPDYAWPDAKHRGLLGKRVNRVDGPVKVTGQARYTYDVNPPGMLYGAMLRCPYPHAKVVSVDVAAAKLVPGVKAVKIIQGPGSEIHWAGDEIVGLAATSEGIAEDALRAIKVHYSPLPFLVSDAEPPANLVVNEGPLTESDLRDMLSNQVPDKQILAYIKQNGVTDDFDPKTLDALAKEEMPAPVLEAIRHAQVKPEAPKHGPQWYKRAVAAVQGDPDAAFRNADLVTSEGVYGIPVITHCCMESHGAVTEWAPDELKVHISTQNLSGIASQMAEPLGISPAHIHVHQDHIGGGFGSKFAADRWTIVAAQLSKLAGGAPVKMMLPRPAELEVAGARPSAYARVKVAAQKDGTLVAWQHDGWGTGGPGGGGSPPIPYIFDIPHRRTQYTAIANNIGPSRAWRAPNHPQAALITMAALDDLADKLGMDPLDFLTKNLELTGPRERFYRDELPIAAELIGWKRNWSPRQQNSATTGAVKRGLGLSLHTWGGRGHESNCDLTIHPSGRVEIKMGTQDLGTGTRTIILMVAAETLGVPMSQFDLLIGDSRYPVSGGSGGSTTSGGVTSSTRRAATDARDEFLARVAPALGAAPEQLEIVDGTVRVIDQPDKSLSWQQACAKLGAMPLDIHGKNPDRSKPPDLTNSGVGGVQMAEVSVDTETGIVRVEKMVAVQDCGLVIDLKTAESQVYGALIMGISYALYEEKFMDPPTGRMLNPNLEFYRLAGIGDIPELVVHMMTGKGYDERGVIGLGEPPVISPGAAISNAVANAIGVRVPFLPLTPERVLAALNSGRRA
jgi:xanthine dehydrogenase YagR molybdenum-binding subunit